MLKSGERCTEDRVSLDRKEIVVGGSVVKLLGLGKVTSSGEPLMRELELVQEAYIGSGGRG